MPHLLDTSILLRLAKVTDPDNPIAVRAVAVLHQRGEVLHLTPQNYVEFRNVATRPVAVNGLGLSPAEAEARAARFEARFPLLEDVPAIHPAWKALVAALGVIGKQVHDARLVAVCHAHRVAHVLTFNTQHFTRLATHGPGIAVAHPAVV